jgi:hypothetical protein
LATSALLILISLLALIRMALIRMALIWVTRRLSIGRLISWCGGSVNEFERAAIRYIFSGAHFVDLKYTAPEVFTENTSGVCRAVASCRKAARFDDLRKIEFYFIVAARTFDNDFAFLLVPNGFGNSAIVEVLATTGKRDPWELPNASAL